MLARIRASLDDESGFGLVETLIALTILVIGLIAVSGLSLASASQARTANWRSQQAAAAQMVLEDVQRRGWWSATSRADTVTVAGHEFPVNIGVTDVTKRVKQVTLVVAGIGDADTVIYRTRLYKSIPLPDPVPVGP
ncbi:MAG: prepilin-type N-terminal cleavage/methylation domain-containing protein [Gemmatimonadales bacterium]